MGFVNRIASFFPTLKIDLRIAHMPYTPIEFVSKNLKVTALYAVMCTMPLFFVLKKAQASLFWIVPIFLVIFGLLFKYSLLTIKARIKKRERDIDKEVLYIGRYLLVKLYSGRPLLNALVETSSSRGIASKYIKEIVDDISTGNTIEDALNNAMVYSPSEKLQKVLFHINNALQLGIDVTGPLELVLEEITREEELEIKKYGKKLNTLVIFYMLAAIIIPSLGTAIFIVISSLLNFSMGIKELLILVFFIIVLQFIFIALFRAIRPRVSL